MGMDIAGIMTGLASGLLWGMNNAVFAAGFPAFATDGGGTADGLFPLAGAAINDVWAALALLMWYTARGRLRAFWRQWRCRQSRLIIAAALLGGPIGQACYALGVIWAGPSYALVITATYPVLGCLLAKVILHQSMQKRMWIGTVLAAFGAILAGYVPAQSPHTLAGLLVSAVAACCWASEIVLASWGMQTMEPEAAITFREVISGTVLTLLALFILPGEGIEPAHLLAGAAQAHILWLAGALAGFSYLFYYRANHRLGCARGMATNATYIIWGVALNVCFSGAALQPFELLGCGLVFAGVLLTAFCQAEA